MSSSSNNNSSHGGGGIGFSGLLTIVFIVLKLCDVIEWSWLWVLSPLWITLLLVILIIVIYLLWLVTFGSKKYRIKKDRIKW